MICYTSTIIIALAGFNVCSSSVITVNHVPNDSKDCPGPIRYYEELGCTPVEIDPITKCPIGYDCDQWNDLPDDKCLLNNQLYDSGSTLKPNHRNTHDKCFCLGGISGWYCEHHDEREQCPGLIPDGEDAEGKYCYLKDTPFQKCPGPRVCVDNESDRPTCKVDGITFRDGDFFIPSAEPEKNCYCGAEYDGKNAEPFCASHNHTWCYNTLDNVDKIIENCVPVYHEDHLPTDCNERMVCQDEKDYVINATSLEGVDPDMLCKFGELRMKIGEELDPHGEFPCSRCICEVPPVPTCLLLPYCVITDGHEIDRSRLIPTSQNSTMEISTTGYSTEEQEDLFNEID